MSITLSSGHTYTDRDTLLKVIDPVDGAIHQSWVIDGKVLVYENIPVNYPAGNLGVFDTLDEYKDEITDVPWINTDDEDNVLINHIDEEEHGFSFPIPLTTFSLYFTEESDGERHGDEVFKYDLTEQTIDDAISYVMDNEANIIGEGFKTEIDYTNNRAYITWKNQETGEESFFTIEPEVYR